MFTARARQTPFLLSEIVPFSAVAGETLLCKKCSDALHDGVISHEQSADHSIDQVRFRFIPHCRNVRVLGRVYHID